MPGKPKLTEGQPISLLEKSRQKENFKLQIFQNEVMLEVCNPEKWENKIRK
jgi:hypothetical protein